MKINSILIAHEIPLKEDIKANLIQVLNMANAFSNGGIQTDLILPYKLDKNYALKQIASIIPDYKDNFNIILVPVKKDRVRFSSLYRFLTVKSKIPFKHDYILTRSPLISMYSILKGQRIIYESHNSYLTKHKLLNWLFEKIFIQFTRSSNFKIFIAISDNLRKKWIGKGILKEKAITLHDGANIDDISEKGDLNASLKELFLTEKIKTIYTGSLYENRGIDKIIRLAVELPEIEFIVAGGPDEVAKKYQDTVKQRGLSNIVFIGYIPHRDIQSVLANGDILLAIWSKTVPTIEFCSPLKIFEYMASNKLIISDGYTTIKEVLVNNESAIFSEPDNYDSLLRCFKNVINNRNLLNLGHNNRDLLRYKYSWNTRVLKIINQLKINEKNHSRYIEES